MVGAWWAHLAHSCVWFAHDHCCWFAHTCCPHSAAWQFGRHDICCCCCSWFALTCCCCCCCSSCWLLTSAPTALGGNLGGITSFLLGLDQGQLAGQLKLDVLVPVQGFKRCVDYANGYGEGPNLRRV
jgi:hypothetical protein